MDVRLELLRGAAIADAADALARLRIEVFRGYPYLYDGSLAYEARYLAGYAASASAVVVAAFDGDAMVGAATAVAARDHSEEIAPALVACGLDPDDAFYLGESVLQTSFRGRGLGHAFFDHREAAARAAGCRFAAFCAVDRAADHPARPSGHVPLDGFWSRRGYQRRPEARVSMSWRELGAGDDVPHTLTCWTRAL